MRRCNKLLNLLLSVLLRLLLQLALPDFTAGRTQAVHWPVYLLFGALCHRYCAGSFRSGCSDGTLVFNVYSDGVPRLGFF